MLRVGICALLPAWKGCRIHKPRGILPQVRTNNLPLNALLIPFIFSYILPPAFGQRNHIGLFFLYFGMICYLFIGVAIISDVFMESIEVITSQTKTIELKNADGEKFIRKAPIWNPTLANLTLMALGSSAPEIILNIYETLITFGETPGELGASTIVGSAAFNFFVISGISIYSVSDDNDERTEEELEEDETPLGVKKIYDMGVFTITCTASMLAYIWSFYCLIDYEVTMVEAWLTLSFMAILLILAYSADKYNERQQKKKKAAKQGSEAKINPD